MTNKSLWIYRITALVLYFAAVLICEKFKLTPAWCFTFAILWLMFITLVFEEIERVIK